MEGTTDGVSGKVVSSTVSVGGRTETESVLGSDKGGVKTISFRCLPVFNGTHGCGSTGRSWPKGSEKKK